MKQVPRRQLALAATNMLETESPAKVAKALAAYLVATRRSAELNLLLRDIETLRHQRTGESEVTVISRHALSEPTKQTLAKLLGDKQTRYNYQQDPSVIGGVKLAAIDWRLDLTAANKLQRLKHLTNKAV